ncbi:hypothetical protein KY289_023698 [Solanum tuberosum]|nr:hypothetical protein KY289_023698 [Solanum tuberosum]
MVSKDSNWRGHEAIGMQGLFIQLKHTIYKWWEEDCATKLKPLLVRWKFPEGESYKCNSNGSSLSSKVLCIRNDQGELVYAKVCKTEFSSALQDEVKGFKRGLLYCLGHNLLHLTMETDSITIKKILDGIWEVPWIISIDIREIMEAMENKALTVTHTFREGNKLADYLTNIIVHFAASEHEEGANLEHDSRQWYQLYGAQSAQGMYKFSIRLNKIISKSFLVREGPYLEALWLNSS